MIFRENNQAGLLFYFQPGAPLTQSIFATKFKESLSAVGIDLTQFTGHKLQKWAATAAVKRGHKAT